MRKPVLYSLVAAVVVLLVATVWLWTRNRQTEQAMTTAAEQSRARFVEAINTIAEIQDSLNAIPLADTTVRLIPGDLRSEQALSSRHRQETLERIALIHASLQRNRDRLGELEADLRRSGIRIAGLQKMIANLKQTVSEKEALVVRLSDRVDTLLTRVTGLESVVAQERETVRAREQSLEERRRDLATIHYIVGSKRDLVSAGLLAPSGGLLGIGRTLEPTGRADATGFTALDTDHESIIVTRAPRIEVMSAQPPASYTLYSGAEGIELHIVDPREFRKVKHLILMTK